MKCILFLLLIIAVSAFIKIPELGTKSTTKLIDTYRDYQYMYHYTNTSQMLLKDLVKFGEELSTTKSLVNYDVRPITSRPEGLKFMHVVFGDVEKTNVQDVSFNFEICNYDVVLFICQKAGDGQHLENLNDLKIWSHLKLKKASAVIVLSYADNQMFFVNILFGDLSGILKPLSFDDDEHRLNLYHLKKLNNFNGHTFNIGFNSFPPSVWCQPIFKSNLCQPKGIEGDLVHILSKLMNFTYRMEDYKGRLPSPWPAMINAVHSEKIDWAVGVISVTEGRLQFVDFSTEIKIEGYALLYSITLDELMNWNDVLKPFQVKVWLFLVMLMVIYSLILHKIKEIVRNYSIGAQNPDFLIIIYRAIVEQNDSVMEQDLVIRLLIGVWALTGIILTTVYKTNLTSTMIKPNVMEPNSALDLLNKNYYFRVDREDWSVLKNNLEKSNDQMFAKILSRVKDDLNYCESIESIFGTLYAVIDESALLQYQILAKCEKTSRYDLSTIRLARQQLFSTYYAWPFQRGSSLSKKFSKLFGILHQTGHLDKWYRIAMPKQIPKSNTVPFDVNAASLSFKTFIGPAFILLSGYGIAFFLLILEFIAYKYKCIIVRPKRKISFVN